MARTRVMIAALFATFMVASPAAAQTPPGGVQMPAPAMMSGLPLPSAELPVGTVTVRVVRGELSSIIPNQPVELVTPNGTLNTKTNDEGRAHFDGLTPGITVQARTRVDGAQVESRTFEVPSSGGIRVMLVGGAAGAAPTAPVPGGPGTAAAPPVAAAKPQSGPITTLRLGQQTRLAIALMDEAIQLFEALEVENPTAVPFDPGPKGLVLPLPRGVQGAALLEGSAPNATVENNAVIVRGPLAPGTTPVHVGMALPYTAGSVEIRQPLPIALTRFALVSNRYPGLQIEGEQVRSRRDVDSAGRQLIEVDGAGAPAGGSLKLEVLGLPDQNVGPRMLAGFVCVLIAVWGLVLAARANPAAAQHRKSLAARREKLFSELVALEEARRSGRLDPTHYATRRQSVLAQLERVYADLDRDPLAA